MSSTTLGSRLRAETRQLHTQVERSAFMATMQDKDFLADAEKVQMEINPVPGAKVQALVKEIYSAPPEIAQKATSFLR